MQAALDTLNEWRARSHAEQLAHFDALRPHPRRGSSGKVRVALACPCLMLGGAEAQQLAIARYADPSKIEWVGCCVVDDRTDPGMVAATSELMPVSIGWEAMMRVAAESDILIAWAVGGLAEAVRRLGSPPKILSVMHSPVESDWGRQVYARATADCFVAVSELALPAMPETTRNQAVVIPNCVDADRLVVRRSREEMHDRWGVPGRTKVAGYLGRFSFEKDPLAMVRLANSPPEGWIVVMVGAGDERVDLVAPPNLILPGSDPAAGDVLNAFDVLVVPSHYESYGLTLAEGLWAGVPVVSTEVGIAKITPGLTRIVPVNADGPTLAAAVLDAYEASGPRPGPELADCGDGVWVGSHVACNEQATRFDRVIHIWRDDRAWGVCDHVLAKSGDGFTLLWREEGPIETMSPPLADVLTYATGPGTLLVHCAAGITRSTAVALACKVARGCDPDRAEAEVRAAMLRDRKRPVCWDERFVARIKATVRPASPAWTPLPLGSREWARANASPERFGRDWTELLCSLAPPEIPPAVDPGVRDRVLSCPDRGGILPISQQDDCGCRGKELSECRAGRGKVAGRVSLRDCLSCRS